MKHGTIFFCYAWDDNHKDDYDLLSFLKDCIEEEDIRVTLDRRSFRFNTDIHEEVKRLKKYDLIVIFFTPELKALLLSPKTEHDRVVREEYDEICNIYDENSEAVFPIILRGTRDTALMSPYNGKLCPIISEFISSKKGKNKANYFIKQQNKSVYNKFIDDIIGQTKFNLYNKSVEYRNNLETIEKLFWLTNTTELPAACLVKSDIYREILNQKYYFVAGRKGSGKSTFINNFRTMDIEYFKQKYKQMIPIKAEAFRHEHLYNELIKRNESDFTIIESNELLSLFWQLYFTLQSIVTIGREIEDHLIKQDDHRYNIFHNISNLLKKMLGLRNAKGNRYLSFNTDSVPKSLFTLVVDEISKQYGEAIDRSNANHIYTSFQANMRADSILERMFGINTFKSFVDALRECQKKIIISVDGFDMRSEVFRETTQAMKHSNTEYITRMNYEKEFYLTLIEVVTNFKEHEYNDYGMSALSENLDFCIVLPRDRYDQIILSDRDSAKKNFCSLTWSAYELLDMCVRRLEYLITSIYPDVNINREDDLFTRWNHALDFFPALPKEISINVNGNIISMGLFNYLLRYSFWRPRDLISILSKMLSYVTSVDTKGKVNLSQNGNVLSEELLRLCIKRNANEIIKLEMISEYKNVFRNLNEILSKFIDGDIIQKPNKFMSIISNMPFDASFAYDLTNPHNKLSVLYQLGIIGLQYNKDIARKHNYIHHTCFMFNAGLGPLEDFYQDDYANAKADIIFNPIFTDKLRLNFNTTELVCNWSNSDILNFHVIKREIQSL